LKSAKRILDSTAKVGTDELAMKTTLEVISPVKRKIVVEVEPEEVRRKVEDTYKSVGKSAKVHGFRPGKVPRNILERYYGAQVADEVSRNLVQETLPKAIEEAGIYPLSPPLVDNGALRQGEGFSYSAVMEVRPEFELNDYMGLEAEKEIIHVNEAEVEKQLEEIRKANAKLIPVEGDREIRENDFASVAYEGYEDGKPVEGIKSENYLVEVGRGEFHPDFERALVGHRAGDTLRVSVQFEKNHHVPKLAGKRVDFEIRVIDIRELDLPELNDEFVKSLSVDFDTTEALKAKIREELTSREERRVERDLRRRLLKKVSEKVEIELPESLVEEEIDYAFAMLQQNLARMGSTLEKAGLRKDKLRDEFRPASERRVKDLLILGEIARQNDLSVDDAELEEGFRQIAAGMNQDPAAVRSYYEANHLVDSYRQRLLEEKTLNFLVKGASIHEVEAAEIAAEKE
jgi:trigger factor